MNLQTPKTKEISDSLIAQLQAELNQVIPLAQKAFMRVLSKALAGLFVILFKYGGWSSLQMFVSTAGLDKTEINGILVSPLTEWGRLVGAGDPIAATQAELGISIIVTTQGGTMPSGTQLVGANNGVTYITTAAIALNTTPVSGNVRAVSDQAGGNGAGTIGNLDFGDILSFANPLGQVARETEVVGKPVIGADAETAATYRQRVLDRFQQRPQGGAYADYKIWGESVPAVTTVFPYTASDPGEVDVYVEVDTDADGIPTQSQLDAVAAAIELDDAGLASRRPVGALVNTLAITRTSFDVTVTSLVVPADQAQTEDDVETAIEAYFRDREPFIDGLSPLPRKDRLTDSSVTAVVEDIVNAAGGIFTGVAFEVTSSGSPETLYALGEGEKAKAAVVNFV